MDFVFLNNLLRGAYIYRQTYSYMNWQKHTKMFLKLLKLVSIASGQWFS